MSATSPVNTDFSNWLYKNFFSGWFNALCSLLFGLFIVWVVYRILDWAILDAVWRVENRDLCTAEAGACWAVIEDRGRLILFGLFPYEEQWRSTLACLAIIATIVLSCLPTFWTVRRLPLLWIAGFGVFVFASKSAASNQIRRPSDGNDGTD